MDIPERDKPRNIRKLTLPDGFQIGLLNLDGILKEVAGLKLTDDKVIRQELLERVKACNYVAPGGENSCSAALLREYRRKFSESGENMAGSTYETKKNQPG